jgi:ribonuclease D
MLTEQFISRPEELAEFCDHLATCSAFGFDTEFIGEETFVPELCLIQVATVQRVAVIDPFAVPQLDVLWRLVTEPQRTAVVHAGREEIRVCQRNAGRVPLRLFDLQIAAGLAGMPHPLGHGALIERLLGMRLSKGETRTDWKKRPLTERQLQYAFDDVRYLLPAWAVLAKRLQERGRQEWLEEESAALTRRSLNEERGVERWRKISGIGGMDRKKLAVVRALNEWREKKAARQNRPVRSVLRDDLVVEIAQRNPRQPHDLEVTRGVAKRDVEEIWEAVQEARALAPEQWPATVRREEDSPQLAPIAGVLNAVLADLCARLELAPSLVANANDLKQLIRSLLRGDGVPAGCPLAAGWRATAILPELVAVLHGERSIRVADLRCAAPLEVKPFPPTQ